jgi:NNP family nitrate/nitrite transporter-like MFS transporter
MRISLLPIFWTLWFLNFCSRTVFSPVLPLIEDELSLSHAQAGGLFAFLSGGYTLTLLLAGSLSSRLGHKRTIVAGFFAMSLALFWVGRAHSYAGLAVFYFLVGVGAGTYIPCIIPIITVSFERQKWGKTLALHDSAASVSIFAVPLLVALSLHYLSWRAVFPILSGACLVAVTIFWLWSPDPHDQEGRDARLLDVLWRKEFWVLGTLWGFAAASNMGIYNILPLFLVNERGMSVDLANTLFGVSRVSGPFLAVMAGFLADRYGAKRILLLSFLLTGISTSALALARSFPLLVAMLAIQGTVSPTFFPVGLVAISKITDFRERSVFTGAAMALGVIGGVGVTPFALGAVADVWTFEIGILVLGILTALATLSLRSLREI